LATVDAYLSGLPVVMVLDEMEPNFGPLRGQRDVRYVTTPRELAESLQTSHQPAAGRRNVSDFFFLDPSLPRWSRLLST
jgi:surface carbohydrate biosynthesis protein (TIGR04326 family)